MIFSHFSFRSAVLASCFLFLPDAVLADSAFNSSGGVVVTIKPLHSLVAGVLGDITQPELLVQGAASPHDTQLKPSQMAALQDAKLVLYIGPDFETFMGSAIRVLPESVRVSSVATDANLSLLAVRESDMPEPEAVKHEHAHDHGDYDLHVWLDPENARRIAVWVTKELSALDFENRDTYKANARRVIEKIDALEAELHGTLADLQDRPFIVFHDAYQYFEHAFGLRSAGFITLNPSIPPSPSHLQAIRKKLRESGAQCIFREPQFSDRLVQTVIEDTDASSGTLDPLGAYLEDGEELYFSLMRGLAKGLKECLA